MNPDDLFVDPEGPSGDESWAPARRPANESLLDGLRRGGVDGISDLDAALALTQQIHDDLLAYGTGGGEDFTNAEIGLAMRGLTTTLKRLGIPAIIPFRDYTTFRTYWEKNGAYGSWAARRQIVSEIFDPLIARLYSLEDSSDRGSSLAEPALSALSDPTAIQEHLRRLEGSIDADPRLAVSVAKDMVESTAKLVLRERKLTYSDKEDLPALVARSQKALKLHAAGVSSDNEEARALKTILGSLTNLTQGVTELRNKVGVGHGRESVPAWVRPRHARLAAGAAGTWCNLMLETLGDPHAPWRSSPGVGAE